jgi:hypothetical protein
MWRQSPLPTESTPTNWTAPSMTTLGYTLFWLGMIVWLVGNVMFLAIVFRYSLIWFFGCLFFPLIDLIYFALNVKKTLKPMLIATAGCLTAAAGYWLGGFNFLR